MSEKTARKRRQAARQRPATKSKANRNGQRLPPGSKRRARFLSRLQEARVIKGQLQELEAQLIANDSNRLANDHPATERAPGLPPDSEGEAMVGEDRFLSYRQNAAEIEAAIKRIEEANPDLMPLVDQLCADEEQNERLQHASRPRE